MTYLFIHIDHFLFLILSTQVEHYWKHKIERDRVKWQRRLDSGRRGPGRAYHSPKEAAQRQFEKKQQHSKPKLVECLMASSEHCTPKKVSRMQFTVFMMCLKEVGVFMTWRAV